MANASSSSAPPAPACGRPAPNWEIGRTCATPVPELRDGPDAFPSDKNATGRRLISVGRSNPHLTLLSNRLLLSLAPILLVAIVDGVTGRGLCRDVTDQLRVAPARGLDHARQPD